MVSTYMKQSTPNEGNVTMNINNLRNSNQDLSLQGQADLIYNLSDVGKFLPNINEYEKYEDMCTEIFTRKRKERQDSENTSTHECKLIRSNSEERNIEEKVTSDDNIRRVSSHEDFEKCKKPTNRSQAYPLQNHIENNLPLRTHNNLPSSNENIFLKDWGKAEIVGEKFAKMYAQDIDNENSIDNYNLHQKYNKNESSPLRSSIHEYVLFPKRISPNRDPNAIGINEMCEGEFQDIERDAEKARTCERRSRARRIPQRRIQKNYSTQDKGITSFDQYTVNLTPTDLSKKSKINSVNNSEDNFTNVTLAMEHYRNQSSEKTTFQDIENTHDTNNQSKGTTKSKDRSPSPDVQSSLKNNNCSTDDARTHGDLLSQPLPSVPLKYSDILSEDNIFYNQNECEPLLDCNIVGYSKEISEIQNQNRLCPDNTNFVGVQVSCGVNILEPDERLQKISKKIQILKKKINKFEIDFEIRHGYRASHADKMNDNTFRKLYVELRKLKSERKNLKRGPSDFMFRHTTTEEQPLKNKPMAEIMAEIERRLEAKRWVHGRPSELENCSRAQLLEEKVAVQRALLWLEGARGRPTLQPDRDSARPLYDRYRTVKRLVTGFDAMKLNSGNTGELATILEHEALPTIESPIESPESGDKTSCSETDSPINSSDNNEGDACASSSTKSTASDKPILGEDKHDSINENLHCLPITELNKLLFEARSMKTSLRNKIKDMEEYYDDRNRKVVKDDKNPVLPVYAKYKETKARIRLLSALVNKQKKSYG